MTVTAEQLATATAPLNRISMGSLAPIVELTLPEYLLLSSVATTGPQSLDMLAEQLGVPKATMSVIGQRLVSLGLAIQLSDGREQRLLASTAGRALVADIIQRRRHVITTALEHLAPDERRTVGDALRTFADLATPQRSRRARRRTEPWPTTTRSPR